MSRAKKLANIVLISLLSAACSTMAPAATPTAAPTPVVAAKPVYQVQRGTVTDEIVFSGRFAASLEENLFFRMDGRVAKIGVRVGDTVKAGDILAELEISDLQNQQAQAQLTLQQAQIKLRSAQDNVAEQQVQLKLALETAQLRLDQAKVRDPEPSVAIAAANRDKALAAVEAAQAAYDRRGQVSGSAEALALQRATWDYEIAKAQYVLAVQTQAAWEYDVRILERAVSLAESNVRKAALSIDPLLQQDVAKAELALDRLNKQIANAQLIATVDGEVTMIAVQIGKTTTAYQAALAIAMPGPLNVSAGLHDEIIKKLSMGQTAFLTFANYPGREFTGAIVRLPYPYGDGSSQDADRSVRVSVQADVPIQRGALATVRIVLRQADDTLWLPPPAIRTFQGRAFVVVQEGDAQRRVQVTTGITTEERVEISDGLSEGQLVVGP